MPMMFLSGSLFPLGGLPTWLSVVTRLNPLTYVVQPMRHLVLQRLDLTAGAEQKLLPPLTWFGWAVPVGVQLLTVGVITVALIGLGARLFASTE
jgi:ABC-2 type transport system permease protein